MCDIPVDVTGGEKIVRAVIYPFHFDRKKNRLKKEAFESKPGTDEVSVIRGNYKDAAFCKGKGCQVATNSAKGQYVGLAVLLAGQIRKAKSEVHDSREQYCGHAHISHGVIKRPHEPLPPDQQLALDKKLQVLRDEAIFHPDPSPETEGWSGTSL